MYQNFTTTKEEREIENKSSSLVSIPERGLVFSISGNKPCDLFPSALFHLSLSSFFLTLSFFHFLLSFFLSFSRSSFFLASFFLLFSLTRILSRNSVNKALHTTSFASHPSIFWFRNSLLLFLFFSLSFFLSLSLPFSFSSSLSQIIFKMPNVTNNSLCSFFHKIHSKYDEMEQESLERLREK